MNWDELEYWKSENWTTVQRRLHELEMAGITYCPRFDNIFEAFRRTPFDQVKVCLVGQDPYPNPGFATGLAFSIPVDAYGWPPTLTTILREYEHDLHYPTPATGDLSDWAARGVLLWNVLPTCLAWQSSSHDWPEWHTLTKEVILTLANLRKIVFVFLGAKARAYVRLLSSYSSKDMSIIELCHPSPRASKATRSYEAKFIGSRMFSRTNDYLSILGIPKVDWRLP